jgi:hypothetical protein
MILNIYELSKKENKYKKFLKSENSFHHFLVDVNAFIQMMKRENNLVITPKNMEYSVEDSSS